MLLVNHRLNSLRQRLDLPLHLAKVQNGADLDPAAVLLTNPAPFPKVVATMHSLPGPSTAYGCNCIKARHQRSNHTTISSTVRKELASYENPHQPPPVVTVKPTKRNASTESLDLLKGTLQECTCAVYSPNSIDNHSCKKCTYAPSKNNQTNQKAQKKHNSSKFKDASTSPKSNSPLKTLEPRSPRSPKSPCAEASTDTKFDFPCSPRTDSHYKRLSTLSINSGSKYSVVCTSPRKQPSPKMSPHKLTPVRSIDRTLLEKSNSLGESKPQKQLRTTRSLSPRPPVKHQHSIMVSDENDIISVKLSPNEEFDESKDKTKNTTNVPEKKKAHSEKASPNLSDYGSLKLDDGGIKSVNNRSTSCLVYVPSDPWTRMSTSPISPLPTDKKQHPKPKKLESKSFSKPSLHYLEDSDPWVWRSNITLNEQFAKKKNSLPHQTKSLSSALSRDELFEYRQNSAARLCQQLNKFDKNLTIPGVDLNFDARKKITRPKLQRSKSPAFYEELFQSAKETPLNKNKSVSSLKIEKNASNSNINGAKTATCYCEANSLNRHSNKCEHPSALHKSNSSITSPTAKKQSSPKLSFPPQSPKPRQPPSSPLQQQQMAQPSSQPELLKTSLTVLNPNLLQPRHSFSTTPSQKDDELQLNIRRLSEQMNKYNPTSPPASAYFSQPTPSFMNDTIIQQQHLGGGDSCEQIQKKRKSVSSGGLAISSTGSLTAVGGIGGEPQKRAASHSKINEPILETRC
ncbi:uncharacterized protein LOC129737960 [Uranotaenia lowii]|uniref:uncharacterized protein LOC129737960 n=1 Tax=Uranotaenia lowii TaxID=190385 RepID=UPI00247A258A|nr:uncharacterized protein LOC129737960 [Uranotaenia lowii]